MNWLRRIRGALGMGLTWAVVGFAIGGVIEVIHNIWPTPLGSAFDIWPMVLAFPGFFGGVGFSVVLGIVGRNRRFSELSMPLFALSGAAGGVLVSLAPALLQAVGIAPPTAPVWEMFLWLLGPSVVAGAGAASGTLALARMSEDSKALPSEPNLTEAGLTAEEKKALLGEG